MLNSLSETFEPRIPRIYTNFSLHGSNLCALCDLGGELRNTLSGRVDGYTAAAGRAGGFLGSLAVGSVISGLLGSVNLILPMVVCELSLIAVIGFISAVLRPILLGRIQNEVTDDVRATIISMQSLMTPVIAAFSQISLGFISDQSGFPAAYIGLAVGLGILILWLFWKGSRHLLQTQIAAPD